MSHRPIARSPDLQRLRDEGYDVRIHGGYLLIRNVPYVNATREVKFGVLVAALDLDNDRTTVPQSHVAMWVGEHPCHSDGRKIITFENNSPSQDLGNGLVVDFTFSAKAAYRDYHHKMTTYIGRITGEAQVIDAAANAQTFPVYLDEESDAVFKYIDTASSRAELGALNQKFAGLKIGIIGLGGTGAYVLDLVAKTQVKEIHLFDGDRFSQHNAFRAPGSTSPEQLEIKLQKVDHWATVHGAMRHGVIPHDLYVDAEQAVLLSDLDFVFLCIDGSDGKRSLVEAIEKLNLSFIDTGLGVVRAEEGLSGLVRVSASTRSTRDLARRHISFAAGNVKDDYSTNIQVAELNALNAAMAVLRWKKMIGFYRDVSREYYAGYSIAANDIVNEDAA
jgi:ThiF family